MHILKKNLYRFPYTFYSEINSWTKESQKLLEENFWKNGGTDCFYQLFHAKENYKRYVSVSLYQ